MKDYSELKMLAEAMKGWDKMTECWPSDENGPDLQIGRLDEEDNRWPLMTVDTEQYDQEQDAPKVAQYYAAANPAAVLALIAEVEALKDERDYCRRVADHNLDLGVQYMNERDKAKTDNELLRAEINHLKSCPLYSTRMNSKRYLWLRDSHIGDDPESINLECGPNNGLNSAIDAAMSNKE